MDLGKDEVPDNNSRLISCHLPYIRYTSIPGLEETRKVGHPWVVYRSHLFNYYFLSNNLKEGLILVNTSFTVIPSPY